MVSRDPSRRDAMRLLAGGGAAALLPGCSAQAEDGDGEPTSPAPTSESVAASSPQPLAALADVPADEALYVGVELGAPAYLVRDGEAVRLLSGICSHAECLVAWVADEQQFHCPCHLGVYDRLGQVVSGPPPAPLTEIPMTVEGGTVYAEG